MDLGACLAVLKRRKWIIIITVLTTLSMVVVGTSLMTPKYEAFTILRVATTTDGSVDWGSTVYADRLKNTYAEMVTSSTMREEIRQEFDLGRWPKIDAEVLSNTELLQITVQDQDPALAAEMINFLARHLLEQSRLVRAYRDHPVSIVGKTAAPSSPASPSLKLNIALGFIASLSGGLGLSLLVENLDTKLYTTKQIQTVAGLLPLGEIPFVRRKKQMIMNGASPQGEAFHRLRINICNIDSEIELKTLLITSSKPREGKSTIVASLAYTIAQLGRRVIVVDCDLRRPIVHTIFGLSNEIGLGTVLRQEATLNEAVQESRIPGVYALTSGEGAINPVELLGSSQMIALLDQMRRQFDMVLLDTPAVAAVADASVLAPIVNGVGLVVSRAQVEENVLQATRQQLNMVGARLIGVIVNRAPQERSFHYYKRASKRHKT